MASVMNCLRKSTTQTRIHHLSKVARVTGATEYRTHNSDRTKVDGTTIKGARGKASKVDPINQPRITNPGISTIPHRTS